MSDKSPAENSAAQKPSNGKENPSDLIKLRFEYAWKWFSFHAEQRVKLFNYMILAFGFFATAIVTVANNGLADLAIGLCLVASILALAFCQLDKRNEALVRLGEDVLADLEQTSIFSAQPGAAIAASVSVRGKSIASGILWRQFLEEGGRQDSRLDAFIKGKHRLYFPLVAILICLLFLVGAVALINNKSEISERRMRVDSGVVRHPAVARTMNSSTAPTAHAVSNRATSPHAHYRKTPVAVRPGSGFKRSDTISA